jgi:predicted transcriptional regulator
LLVSETSTPAVARALVSEQSRRILVALITKPMSIDDIAEEQKLPLSSCYKIMRELENHGIVKKTKSVYSRKGKKSGQYVSMIKNANIKFLAGSLSVDIEMNDGVEI